LAKSRYCLFFAMLLALLFTRRLPLHAQLQRSSSSSGSVEESHTVTSAPHRRAKLVDSEPKADPKLLQQFLGNCCKNSFLPPKRTPPKVTPPLAPESLRFWSAEGSLVSIAVPVYIPYAIGYEPDQTVVQAEAGEEESESAGANNQLQPRELMSYDSYTDFPADEADDEGEPPAPEETVVAQPATILVYRDGHRADVVNYAILGDALFDFDEDRTYKIPLSDLNLAATRKVNDDRGVDFKLPPATFGGSTAQ